MNGGRPVAISIVWKRLAPPAIGFLADGQAESERRLFALQDLSRGNPKQTPPRVVTGPILLAGLATCASCRGGMTERTGKSGRSPLHLRYMGPAGQVRLFG